MIRVVDGKVQLYGDEWIKFVEDNVPASVRTLHFIKEGEDTFYVTGYAKNGSEGSGYDVSRRFVKCLVRCKTGGQVPLRRIYILLYRIMIFNTNVYELDFVGVCE